MLKGMMNAELRLQKKTVKQELNWNYRIDHPLDGEWCVQVDPFPPQKTKFIAVVYDDSATIQVPSVGAVVSVRRRNIDTDATLILIQKPGVEPDSLVSR